MATYRLCVVYVLLCTAYAVISVKISGIIWQSAGVRKGELELSQNINGDQLIIPHALLLKRHEEENSVPALSLKNIKTGSLDIINLSLENVPVFENVSVEVITIMGNEIKYVPTNAFNGTRMRSLFLTSSEIQNMSVKSIYTDIEYLNLRFNKLTEFSQDWFKDPSRVTNLDLSHNRIENLQDHAFNQMPHLRQLTLNSNHINRIGSEVFTPGMTKLYLQYNSIEELTLDMFVRRTNSIRHLYIHYNQLNYLPEALMLKLKIEYISIRGNPWQCKCLQNIERWIREKKMRRDINHDRPGEPVCVVSVNFPNICVPAVDKELQQTYARALTHVHG